MRDLETGEKLSFNEGKEWREEGSIDRFKDMKDTRESSLATIFGNIKRMRTLGRRNQMRRQAEESGIADQLPEESVGFDLRPEESSPFHRSLSVTGLC